MTVFAIRYQKATALQTSLTVTMTGLCTSPVHSVCNRSAALTSQLDLHRNFCHP
jgi:hypothetical protein